MRTICISLFAIAFASACGDDGGKTNPKVDAGSGSAIDSNGSADIDAPPTSNEPMGRTCTPPAGGMVGQGDCPTGYVCLGLQGGTHPWCSKTCTPGAGDTCGTGYMGTGVPNCYLSVGGATYCGVICQDPMGAPDICNATTCNGTCPGALACTASLTSGMPPMEVAKGCQ